MISTHFSLENKILLSTLSLSWKRCVLIKKKVYQQKKAPISRCWQLPSCPKQKELFPFSSFRSSKPKPWTTMRPIWLICQSINQSIYRSFAPKVGADFKILVAFPIHRLPAKNNQQIRLTAKRSTISLKCTFYIGIAKLKQATFLLKLMPFLNE